MLLPPLILQLDQFLASLVEEPVLFLDQFLTLLTLLLDLLHLLLLFEDLHHHQVILFLCFFEGLVEIILLLLEVLGIYLLLFCQFLIDLILLHLQYFGVQLRDHLLCPLQLQLFLLVFGQEG